MDEKKKNRPNSPTLVIKEEQHTDRGVEEKQIKEKETQKQWEPKIQMQLAAILAWTGGTVFPQGCEIREQCGLWEPSDTFKSPKMENNL